MGKKFFFQGGTLTGNPMCSGRKAAVVVYWKTKYRPLLSGEKNHPPTNRAERNALEGPTVFHCPARGKKRENIKRAILLSLRKKRGELALQPSGKPRRHFGKKGDGNPAECRE